MIMENMRLRMFYNGEHLRVNCKKELQLLELKMLAIAKETAVHALVGSIVWEFRRLKKAKESGDERPRLRAL